MTAASGRTVVVAYDIDPGHAFASVPLMAYKIAQGFDALTGCTLVAHRRDRQALRGALPGVEVHYVGSRTLSWLVRRIGRALFPQQWNILSVFDFPEYLLFDLQAYLLVRRLTRAGGIRQVLRVNPVSFQFPSLLPRAGVPVFTGPHNGGMAWPPGFGHLEQDDRTASRPRAFGDVLHRLYDDATRYAGIFVAHDLCAQTVPEPARERVHVVPENGVDRVQVASVRAGDATSLLYVGRLTAFKAVDVVLRALARLPEDVHLTVVGDGPQRAALEQLAEELGLGARCRFEGLVPHEELGRYYGNAGVFVFPSVRESGGAVLLEAMSFGVPCVVADWGGPSTYVTDGGVRLAVDGPQQLEDGLVEAVCGLLADPDGARELARRAHASIEGDFLWTGKVRRLDELMRAAPPRSTANRVRRRAPAGMPLDQPGAPHRPR